MSARAASSCGSGFARRLAIALLIAVAAPLSGCAADPNPAGSAGVSVALYQTRSDVAAERLEIQIVNDGDETLVVTRAEYRGPEFSQVLSWHGEGSRVPAGHRLDLPVPLAELACPAAAARTPIVELTILRGGGEQRLELAPSDPFGQLARLHDDGCFAVSLARLGELRIVDFSAPLDATEPAGLVFDAAARGDSGYTVTGVRSTTLISPAPDGVGRDEVPLAWRVGSPETSWTLAFVPTRCDPHAVLEDKQGTLIPFSAQRDDGVAGRLVVAAPEPVRTRVLEYVARFCGFAP